MRRMVTTWLAGVAAVSFIAQAEPQRPPTFKASTELVLIEAQVVARDGSPVAGLKPDQFEVFIDGRKQPIVNLDFFRLSAAGQTDTTAGAASASTSGGRTIVLAIDQESFPVSGQASAREAALRVANTVAPEDRLGLIAFPGSVAVAPTIDHQAVRAAIAKISGLRTDVSASRFNISAMEASRIKTRDSSTKEITDRECRLDPGNPNCPIEVVQDAGRIADALERQAQLSVSGLRGVLDTVGALPGRKTLMLISAGLPMNPRGTPNPDSETAYIAQRAAAFNINLYVFYMNVHFLKAFSAEYGKRNNTLFDDITLFGYGLEKFADGAGGSFFQVEVNSDPFVARALRETSAVYLLAVQARPEDRDGKDHFIRLTVKERGATVRYRKVVNIPVPPR
jgi:VWFA-related protein